jgi:hypothetical protein
VRQVQVIDRVTTDFADLDLADLILRTDALGRLEFTSQPASILLLHQNS